MMVKLKILCIVVGVLFSNIVGCHGKSDSCIRLYKEGGAPAVLQSPECSFEYIHPKKHNYTTNCQFASLKGRREYQEDRVLCDLNMETDLLDYSGDGHLKIGLAAVFDGHGGKEASELAVQLLPYYLQLHISFLSQKEMELFEGRQMDFPVKTEVTPFAIQTRLNKSKTLEVIQEAILLTISEVDSVFYQLAVSERLLAGTTATIALLAGNELLIANVGDSKALLCSEKTKNSNAANQKGNSMAGLHVIELTKDHHPDRDDEKARIEGSGGFVTLSGVPRVNGILAVSRAIGDVYLKRYGVIAEPDIADWRHLDSSEVFLVVGSDGIFEGLSTQGVCNLLYDAHSQGKSEKHSKSAKCVSSSLAKCIVNMAYEKGSTDNLSAIVIPLTYK